MGNPREAPWVKSGSGAHGRPGIKGASPHPVPPAGRPKYPGLEKPCADLSLRLDADLGDDRFGSLRIALLDTVFGRPGRNGLRALERSPSGSAPRVNEMLELMRRGPGEALFPVGVMDVAEAHGVLSPPILVMEETHFVVVAGDADPRELLATMMLHAAHRHGEVVVYVSPGSPALVPTGLDQVASVLAHFLRKG